MKYIIDVDKDRIDCSGQLFIAVDIPNGQSNYEIPTGIWVKDYTEPDRKAIEDAQEEVWKFAYTLMWTIPDTECTKVFGDMGVYVLKAMSYREAKAKYEVWKQDRDRIKIGDEVVNHLDKTKIIFAINEDKDIAYGADFSRYPVASEAFSLCKAKKTGRHFPQVEELLKAMKGKE